MRKLLEVGLWTGREARALRVALRLSVRAFADHLGVAARTISKWEAGGTHIQPRPHMQAVLDTALGQAENQSRLRFMAMLGIQRHEVVDAGWNVVRSDAAPPMGANSGSKLETLRYELTEALTDVAVTPSSLEDWESVVARHGNTARVRPAGIVLDSLSRDLAELYLVVRSCRTSSSLRQTTRLLAQMAGLVCLTLIKLDDHSAFRRWARTARLASSEAGDRVTYAWVLAQEAYGHYYGGDMVEAVTVAQAAQAISGKQPSPGSALAAALEARAQAHLGKTRDTHSALARAESHLSALDDDFHTASAFGYSEAQLRFHEGNALTHLGSTRLAWEAQGRALQLCPSSDYMDRAMTRLDRAECLLKEGNVADAIPYATDAINDLDSQQRRGIITLRGEQLLRCLPARQRHLPVVQEFRDMLALRRGT